MKTDFSELFGQTSKSILMLPRTYRDLVEELSQHVENNFTPFKCKQTIWKVISRKRIAIAPELFENLREDHSLEMWSVGSGDCASMKFVMAIGTILSHPSYTIEEIATRPWSELFERRECFSRLIGEAVCRALVEGVTQYDVTPFHDVFEINSRKRRTFSVSINQITPYFGPDGEKGIFALVLSKPTLTEKIAVKQVSLKVVGKRQLSSEN